MEVKVDVYRPQSNTLSSQNYAKVQCIGRVDVRMLDYNYSACFFFKIISCPL